MNLIYSILATLVVSSVSLVGILSLVFNERVVDKIVFMLISFAAGSLIGVSFLHIIPEIISELDSSKIFYYVVAGFTIFFILEKYFYWRHCHKGERCELHPVSYLNLFGDALHNFIDGILIGSSFSINIEVGVLATMAVILHEIPQEIGDFVILIHSGFSKLKALLVNFLVSLTAILGAVFGYILSDNIKKLPNYILPIVAGGFIYVASCDLIPELHRERSLSRSFLSLVLFLLGILVIVIIAH